MKIKVGSILVLIILLIVVFLLLFNKETTLKDEGFGNEIDISNVTEIEVIRGSDDKKVILKEGQTKELFNKFLNAKLKEVEDVDGELTESFWITIREDGKRVLGITIDNKLALSPYDYNGNKKNSENYLLEDDSILKSLEQLFEWQKLT